jgi:hypothetical protein
MMDKATTALDEATTRLSSILSCSGGVLISGIDTLVRGDYYVMANNPGGDPGDINGLRIGTSLTASRTRRGRNDWMEENGPFSQRIKAVMDSLGTQPEKTFCTNAVFVRSRGQSKLNPWNLWWDHCWSVHQIFLEIVRPRVVVCLGCDPDESAWAMLRQPTGAKYATQWQKWDGATVTEGKWTDRAGLKLSDGTVHPCAVLGLPHPSNGRPGNWLKAGTSWTLSAPALEKVALARAAAGR